MNVEEASYTNAIGAPVLSALLEGPGVRCRAQRAFYYVRVLEIPTPRWTTYDAKFFGVELPDGRAGLDPGARLHVADLVHAVGQLPANRPAGVGDRAGRMEFHRSWQANRQEWRGGDKRCRRTSALMLLPNRPLSLPDTNAKRTTRLTVVRLCSSRSSPRCSRSPSQIIVRARRSPRWASIRSLGERRATGVPCPRSRRPWPRCGRERPPPSAAPRVAAPTIA